MTNIINLSNKQRENELPSDVMKDDTSKMVRIPIIEKMFEIDGELYYKIQGDPTSRRWKDYSHKNFN